MVYTDGIHMVADTLTELHLFALKIGVKRCWYHGFRKNHPHYDLMGNKLDLALSKGAIKVCSKKVVEISKMSIINDKKVNDFLKEVSNQVVSVTPIYNTMKGLIQYVVVYWCVQ